MFWEQDKSITILVHKPVYFITVIQRKINNIMDVSAEIIYFLRVRMILQRNIIILRFVDLAS
jgi:hypothetical protein